MNDLSTKQCCARVPAGGNSTRGRGCLLPVATVVAGKAYCATHCPDATEARREARRRRSEAKTAQRRDRAEQAQREAREAALWRALGEAMMLGRAVVAIDSTVVGGLDPADHLKHLLERA